MGFYPNVRLLYVKWYEVEAQDTWPNSVIFDKYLANFKTIFQSFSQQQKLDLNMLHAI